MKSNGSISTTEPFLASRETLLCLSQTQLTDLILSLNLDKARLTSEVEATQKQAKQYQSKASQIVEMYKELKREYGNYKAQNKDGTNPSDKGVIQTPSVSEQELQTIKLQLQRSREEVTVWAGKCDVLTKSFASMVSDRENIEKRFSGEITQLRNQLKERDLTVLEFQWF
eukprot:TRINITY_DN4240_c0_g4_i1.p1 TRINITY_DN4240_c0_g4~~TRINITY_DN4240_c0_g4_i1.p1  ORF type:complete len:170 (+),score=39.22 TRINITY_DN4240_c0_g4_i1:120-629(+)